jgi:type IV pilus assembly protein PilA
MLARIRKTQEEREGGFTLIELLVVIIIIGILAAIAIPTFLNQRQKGYRADVKSALKNAATAAESYAVENQGSYTGLDLSELQGEGFKSSEHHTAPLGTTTVTVDAAGNQFCIAIVDDRLGGTESWGYASDTGTPAEGTCAAGVFTP